MLIRLAAVPAVAASWVPDGVLVRVSSIDRNNQNAYALQENFLQELLGSMTEKDRARIAGRTNE